MGTYALFLLIPIAYAVGYKMYSFYWETAPADKVRFAEAMYYPGVSLFRRYNMGYVFAIYLILMFGGGALAGLLAIMVVGLVGTLAVDFIIDFHVSVGAYVGFFTANPALIGLVPAGIVGGFLYRALE